MPSQSGGNNSIEERRGEATTTFNLADCGRPKRMRDVARRKQEYKGWMSNGGRKEGRDGETGKGERRRGGKRRPLKHGGGKHAKAGMDAAAASLITLSFGRANGQE